MLRVGTSIAMHKTGVISKFRLNNQKKSANLTEVLVTSTTGESRFDFIWILYFSYVSCLLVAYMRIIRVAKLQTANQ